MVVSLPQGGEAQQQRQLFVIPKCSFVEFFRVPFLILLFFRGLFSYFLMEDQEREEEY